MIIYCDYCGARIDTDKHSTCPSCGSSYANDEELKAYKERQNRLDDLSVRQKELEIDRMELENDALRNKNDRSQTVNSGDKMQINRGCLIPMVVLSIFGFFFCLMLICIGLDSDSSSNKNNGSEQTRKNVSISYSLSKIDMPEIDIPEITVSTGDTTSAAEPVQYGNKVVCDGFTLTCEGIEVSIPDNHKTGEGNTCIMCRFVIENTGDKKVYPLNSITCLCDGYVCSRLYNTPKRPFSYDPIPAGAKAEGYFYFEVPKDGKKFTFVYDNKVNLEVDAKALTTSPSD